MKCLNCGEIEYVCVDGYAVGDRLLEGVIFHYNKDGSVNVEPDASLYFEQLNTKLWLKRMKEFCEEMEIEDYTCPKCNGIDIEGV